MTREGKSIALAGLTLFIYALTGFFKDGALIFPFPLNEFIFLIISIRFAFWHYRRGALPYLFLASSITAVLGTVFLWETVLSNQQLEHFVGYTVVDWARFLSQIFLAVAGIYFISAYRKWYLKALFAIGLGVYTFGFVIDQLDYRCSGLLLIAILLAIKPVRQPFHWLWILIFLLEASEWITFALLA